MREVIFEKDAKIFYRNRYGKIEHIASLKADIKNTLQEQENVKS